MRMYGVVNEKEDNWEIAIEFMSGCIVGPDSPLDRELCLIVRKNIRKNLLPSNVSLTYVQCPCVLPVLGHPPSTLPVHQRTRTQILVDEDVMRCDIPMCEAYSIPHPSVSALPHAPRRQRVPMVGRRAEHETRPGK